MTAANTDTASFVEDLHPGALTFITDLLVRIVLSI
jgi:hypothetical protein